MVTDRARVSQGDSTATASLLEQRETVRLLGREDGGVLTVELHRPDVLNAMSGAMRQDLSSVLDLVAEGPWPALVLCGAGRAFSSGADLGAFLDEVDVQDADAVRRYIEDWNRVILRLRTAPIPTVAAVHGAAYGGGCNLALACDLVVAGASAKLCQPYVDIGAIADLGSTWLLPRLVGPAMARRMIMLGEVLDAPTAVSVGLVSEQVPDERLRAHALGLAERLGGKDRSVLLANRELLDRGADVSFGEALDAEVEANVRLLGVAGFQEATRRFSRAENKRGGTDGSDN